MTVNSESDGHDGEQQEVRWDRHGRMGIMGARIIGYYRSMRNGVGVYA